MSDQMNYLAIDPGTQTTGYAILRQDMTLKYFGMIQSKYKNWVLRSQEILDKLSLIIQKEKIHKAYIEMPEYWQSAVGLAARESGSTQKLSFLIGGMHYLISKKTKVILVTPSQWKGQMSKEIVRNRLIKHYTDKQEQFKSLDHNIIDAIGIGFFMLKYGKKDD